MGFSFFDTQVDGVESKAKGEGSLASSGYGSQNQIRMCEDPNSGSRSSESEGDNLGSASSRDNLSKNEFRTELQSMINSMNSISASFSNPNFHNGRQQRAMLHSDRDPLYDIAEGRSPNVSNIDDEISESTYFGSNNVADVSNSNNRFSNGSGIAYLLQNRQRNSLQSSTSFDSSQIINSDLINSNNNARVFCRSMSEQGPESLPPTSTATIHRHYANPQIPVLNGNSLFSGGSGGPMHNPLHRNNSLPRPHSIAGPQQSSFMKYRLKRDFV